MSFGDCSASISIIEPSALLKLKLVTSAEVQIIPIVILSSKLYTNIPTATLLDSYTLSSNS